MPDIKYAQTEAVDKGSLKVEVLANRTRRPIEGAKITISYSGKPDSTVEEVSADDSGMSEKLTLDAPPLEYSMEPSENQPFAQYTVKVTAPGYRPVSISGVQVFSEHIWCRCMEHFKAYRARNWNYTLLDWQNDRTHCFSYILLPDSGGSAVHKKLEALHGASGTACLNF